MKLVYNVGVSDIIFYLLNKHKERQLFRPNNLYELTKQVYEKIKEDDFKFDEKSFSVDLSYYDLKFDEEIFYYLEFPLIKYFLEFDEFVLIGTEQKEKNLNSSKDTFYLAKILELVLKKLGKDVKIIKLQDNPVDLEKMVDFYEKILENENPDFFNITTGTPIQSIAMSLIAYKNNKKIVYKPWSENSNLIKWNLKKIIGEKVE